MDFWNSAWQGPHFYSRRFQSICGERGWGGWGHSSIKELLPPGRGSAGVAQQCPVGKQLLRNNSPQNGRFGGRATSCEGTEEHTIDQACILGRPAQFTSWARSLWNLMRAVRSPQLTRHALWADPIGGPPKGKMLNFFCLKSTSRPKYQSAICSVSHPPDHFKSTPFLKLSSPKCPTLAPRLFDQYTSEQLPLAILTGTRAFSCNRLVEKPSASSIAFRQQQE